MSDALRTTEIKAFVPAKDFALSKAFYADIGFTQASEGGGVAYFHRGSSSFLLQDHCVLAHAESLCMHLLVEDVHAWHRHLLERQIVEKYSVKLTDPIEQPWRMIDFSLTDPSGVCWRIAQNI
ncbi:MAG: VOC family protein [Granulosicoccaceae bacterium]